MSEALRDPRQSVTSSRALYNHCNRQRRQHERLCHMNETQYARLRAARLGLNISCEHTQGYAVATASENRLGHRDPVK